MLHEATMQVRSIALALWMVGNGPTGRLDPSGLADEALPLDADRNSKEYQDYRERCLQRAEAEVPRVPWTGGWGGRARTCWPRPGTMIWWLRIR